MSSSEEQDIVREKAAKWFSIKKKVPKTSEASYMTIGGYSGTGKTYLIGDIAKEVKSKYKKINIAFVAFTGKASSVLNKRLNEANVLSSKDHFVGTIHSLMYKPYFIINSNGQKILAGWRRKSKDDIIYMYDLIIIDEASMVNQEIWRDIRSYGVPIIAVGDHGQLPPIGDNFNLLEKPNYVLKTIHRQALDSPIIQLSIAARKNGFIKPGFYGKDVFKLDWSQQYCKNVFDGIQWDKNYIVLCGFNQTRVALNNRIREKLGFKYDFPYPGERLICLKNNHTNKIMNGQLGTLTFLLPFNKNINEMTIEMDDTGDMYQNLVHNFCFGKTNYDGSYDVISLKKMATLLKRSQFKTIDLFDFGYAISVHRSQGSEWNNVVLFEQRTGYWDDEFYRRWLYTAVTRAKEKLFIVSNYW